MAGEKMTILRGPAVNIRIKAPVKVAIGDVLLVNNVVGFCLDSGKKNAVIHLCIRAPIVQLPNTLKNAETVEAGEALGWAARAIVHGQPVRNSDRDLPGVIGFVYEDADANSAVLKYVWGAA